MTKLMLEAIEALRGLSDERQDYIVGGVLRSPAEMARSMF